MYLSVLSEIVGGISSIFPAIYTTIIVSLSISQGEDVRDGVIGSLMMGCITIGLFSLVNAWLIPVLGLAWSVVLSMLISSVGGAIPGVLYLRWRRNVCAKSLIAVAPMMTESETKEKPANHDTEDTLADESNLNNKNNK